MEILIFFILILGIAILVMLLGEKDRRDYKKHFESPRKKKPDGTWDNGKWG